VYVKVSGMRIAALIAAVLALAPASSSAVTLMVNGDTPARYWQRAVDNSAMRSFPGPADLFVIRDPERTVQGWFKLDEPDRPPTIEVYLDGDEHAADGVPTLRHEIGHGTVTWARSQGAWGAAQDRRVARILGVTADWSVTGLPPGRDPEELVADAYALCSVRGTRARHMALMTAIVSTPYRLRSTDQLDQLCDLIRGAAAEAHRRDPSGAAGWVGRALAQNETAAG
jgi:hypothetical protein